MIDEVASGGGVAMILAALTGTGAAGAAGAAGGDDDKGGKEKEGEEGEGVMTDAKAVEAAIELLTTMTASAAAATSVMEGAGVECVVATMGRHSSSPGVIAAAVVLLGTLAQRNDISGPLHASGGVEVLVQALTDYPGEGNLLIACQCVALLESLLTGRDSGQILTDLRAANGVSALVQVICNTTHSHSNTNGDNHATRALTNAAVRLLGGLSTPDEVRRAIANVVHVADDISHDKPCTGGLPVRRRIMCLHHVIPFIHTFVAVYSNMYTRYTCIFHHIYT